MHPAQQLHRLQQTDNSFANVEQRLAEIAVALGETEELRAARQAVDSTAAELQRWQITLRDRELEVKALNSKVKTREDHVYGGRVRNPKELKNLQRELQSLRRRTATKEDAVLEAMLELELLGERMAAQQDTLAHVQAEWQNAQETLLAEQVKLGTQQSDLLAQRQEQASAAERYLALYEELRRRKAGRPVALLRDGVCQACGMSLPTGEAQRVKYAQEICRCSSCGRVLWAA